MAAQAPEEPADEWGKAVVRNHWFHGSPERVEDHQRAHERMAESWESGSGAFKTLIDKLHEYLTGPRLDAAIEAFAPFVREASAHGDVARERAKRCGQLADAYRDGSWKLDSVVAISRVHRLAELRADLGYTPDPAPEDAALAAARRAVDLVVAEVAEHAAHMPEGETFGLLGDAHAPAGDDSGVDLDRPAPAASPEPPPPVSPVASPTSAEPTAAPAAEPHPRAAPEPDPFQTHANAWPPAPAETPPAHFGETVVHEPERTGHHETPAGTEPQSASAPAREEDAATETQAASAPGEVIDVDVPDDATTTAGAAAVMPTAGLRAPEAEYRPRNARRGHHQELGELPDQAPPATDWLTVAKALCQILAAVAGRGGSSHLAPGSPLEYAIGVYEDWQGVPWLYIYTNAGYGVFPAGAFVPEKCALGFESAANLPIVWHDGRRAAAGQGLVGTQLAAESALRGFQAVRDEQAAQNARLALLGILSTGEIPEHLRREIVAVSGQVLGGHPPDPEIIDGPALAGEPARADRGQLVMTHPLYHVDKPLADHLDRAIANLRADPRELVGIGTRIADLACAEAELANRPAVQGAFAAIARGGQVDRHAVYTDLGQCLDPVYRAVAEEARKPVPDRDPWSVIIPYRRVIAHWALESLILETSRTGTRAPGDPYWLHNIAYFAHRAKLGDTSELAPLIPAFPDDPYQPRP